MDSPSSILEGNLEKILRGEGLEFDSVAEQVDPVTLRKNVCYIVGAVIFNSKVNIMLSFLHVSVVFLLEQVCLVARNETEGSRVNVAYTSHTPELKNYS